VNGIINERIFIFQKYLKAQGWLRF